MIFLESFLRYFLAALSTAIAMYLQDNGFDPADADKLALGISGGISAMLLIYWSVKKNRKIKAEREILRQNNGDPITWNQDKQKDHYND